MRELCARLGVRLHPGPAQDPGGGPALPQVPRRRTQDGQALRLLHPATAPTAAARQGGALTVARTNALLKWPIRI